MTENSTLAGTLPVDTIARVLDLTPRRVQQLANEGWIPKSAHGEYSLAASIRGYIRYLRAGAGEEGIDVREERARLARARREIQEMKAKKLRGELVSAAKVREALVRLRFDLENGVALSEAGRRADVLLGSSIEDWTTLL